MYVLGDASSDAFLATPQGQAALAAAQAAAAKLPAGFTMGDPTSDLWGASFYNGQKIIGTSATGPDGKPHYWVGDVGTYGPVVDPTIDAAIQAAANAAYAVYNGVEQLRTASPAMFAILSDPEWIALEGQGQIVFSTLSAELQEKIKAVPLLYEQLTDYEKYLTDAEAQQAAAAAAASSVPKPPATSIVDGLEVYADGSPVPGGYNALLDLIHQQEAAGTTAGVWSPAMVSLVNQNPKLYDALPVDVKADYQRTGFSLSQQGTVTPAANIQPAPGQTAANPAGMPAPASSASSSAPASDIAPAGALDIAAAPASSATSSAPTLGTAAWLAIVGVLAIGGYAIASTRPKGRR